MSFGRVRQIHMKPQVVFVKVKFLAITCILDEPHIIDIRTGCM